MFPSDSVDLIEASIRVINGGRFCPYKINHLEKIRIEKTEFGNLSSIGRLEVKNGAVWGSVWCGRFSSLNNL